MSELKIIDHKDSVYEVYIHESSCVSMFYKRCNEIKMSTGQILILIY